MLRVFTFVILSALPAGAHPGHLAEVAGHGHWIGLAAAGLAAALAAWAWAKAGKQAPEDTAQEDDEPSDAEEEAHA